MNFGVALAGGVSAVLAYAELVNCRGRLPCWRASLLVMCRMAIEAGAGAASYSLVTAALHDVTWFTGIWPILLAGFCGSTLLRSQLALLGSGQESSYFGPAVVYQRLQRTIDREIKDIDSSWGEQWIYNKVLPSIGDLDPKILAARAKSYLEEFGKVSNSDLTQICDQFDTLVEDTHGDDETKRATLVRKVMKVGGKRFVRGLLKAGSSSLDDSC